MILETILAALVPVGIEGVKQVFARFIGGVRPTTIEEKIRLDENEINKLNALAALDNPGGVPSQWVIDLRASARYLGAGCHICWGNHPVLATRRLHKRDRFGSGQHSLRLSVWLPYHG